MEKTIKYLGILLLVFLLGGFGCSRSNSDPMQAFRLCLSQDPHKLDKAIQDDYKDYIQKLSSEERNAIGPIDVLEDGSGQHAISIHISQNGTEWSHTLIYDKENQRIKTIKKISGHSRC